MKHMKLGVTNPFPNQLAQVGKVIGSSARRDRQTHAQQKRELGVAFVGLTESSFSEQIESVTTFDLVLNRHLQESETYKESRP